MKKRKFLYSKCLMIAMLVSITPITVHAGANLDGEQHESKQLSANASIYDFKDNKTSGTVTVTKIWNDGLTNEERKTPDIDLSTEKPSKNINKYTVTFHGNGFKFDDGNEENEIVFNESGQIVSGTYKVPTGRFYHWYAEKECRNEVDIDSILSNGVKKDTDLWADAKTYVVNDQIIGQIAKNLKLKHIIFTDDIRAEESDDILKINGIDSDGDNGIVGWVDKVSETLYITSQKNGQRVIADNIPSFSGVDTLESVDFENLSISDLFDTLYADDMFYGCTNLKFEGIKNISNIDFTRCRSFRNMFSECNSLTEFDLGILDMSNVTDVSNMFNRCGNLKRVYGNGKLPTAGVGYMFGGCKELVDVDLSGLKESTVNYTQSYSMEYAYYMFEGDENLVNVNLSGIDSSKVKDFTAMFAGCSSLKNVTFGGRFSTESAVDLHRMFENCYAIEELDLNCFDASNVEGTYDMFQNCKSLKRINLSNFHTPKLTSMWNMFDGCIALKNLDLSSFDLTTNNRSLSMDYMFSNSGLETIKVSDKWIWNKNINNKTKSRLPAGEWKNTKGITYTSDGSTCSFPNNVADTYTKIS